MIHTLLNRLETSKTSNAVKLTGGAQQGKDKCRVPWEYVAIKPVRSISSNKGVVSNGSTSSRSSREQQQAAAAAGSSSRHQAAAAAAGSSCCGRLAVLASVVAAMMAIYAGRRAAKALRLTLWRSAGRLSSTLYVHPSLPASLTLAHVFLQQHQQQQHRNSTSAEGGGESSGCKRSSV